MKVFIFQLTRLCGHGTKIFIFTPFYQRLPYLRFSLVPCPHIFKLKNNKNIHGIYFRLSRSSMVSLHSFNARMRCRIEGFRAKNKSNNGPNATGAVAFRGVSIECGRWRARIRLPGETIVTWRRDIFLFFRLHDIGRALLPRSCC